MRPVPVLIRIAFHKMKTIALDPVFVRAGARAKNGRENSGSVPRAPIYQVPNRALERIALATAVPINDESAIGATRQFVVNKKWLPSPVAAAARQIQKRFMIAIELRVS